MSAAVCLILLALTGCNNLPPADCQLRAGAVNAEGVWDPFGASAQGGAATWHGDETKCPNFRAMTRSANGSIVCKGERDWCDKALENTPIPVTPEQLRELLGDDTADD